MRTGFLSLIVKGEAIGYGTYLYPEVAEEMGEKGEEITENTLPIHPPTHFSTYSSPRNRKRSQRNEDK